MDPDEMLKYLSKVLMSHKGEGSEITSQQIASLLGIYDNNGTPITRALIKRCAYEYHIPLAANGRGYYVITNKDELRKYCRNLDFRANEIRKRKEMIEEFYNEKGI